MSNIFAKNTIMSKLIHIENEEISPLIAEIKSLIEQARKKVAYSVNAELSLLNWNIGKQIRHYILKNTKAEYGKKVIKELADILTFHYGKGFTRSNLLNYIQFAEVFPDIQIVHTLCGQFTWSHIRIFIYIKDELQRQFYMEMCRIENWSVRGLQNRMNSMLYERTALSRKPEELIKNELALLSEQDVLSPDLVFKDPYFLDFLGLKDIYSEKDLEDAILNELQNFILELGGDFSFMARQKRMTIGNRDYYLDLLFFHRRLKRLVAIELKIGEFQAEHKGQMELYLRWLEKYMQMEGEQSPIGLILCASKSEEHIELLRLDETNIRVSEYFTELPPRELLVQKLHELIENAKKRWG